MRVQLQPGEPCDRPGCLSTVSHPCEGCGRVGGHTYSIRVRLVSPDGSTLIEGVLLESDQPDVYGNVYPKETLQDIARQLETMDWEHNIIHASVVEQADTPVLKTGSLGSEGSTPSIGTEDE